MSSAWYIQNLSTPMQPEEKKNLDELERRLNDVALMTNEYLKKEREDIYQSDMSAELKAVFNAKVQEAYQKRVSASLSAGMARLNTGPDTLEQNLTNLAACKDDMEKRDSFLQSLAPGMREQVLKARDASTRRKLAEILPDADDTLDWSEGEIQDEKMDES